MEIICSCQSFRGIPLYHPDSKSAKYVTYTEQTEKVVFFARMVFFIHSAKFLWSRLRAREGRKAVALSVSVSV